MNSNEAIEQLIAAAGIGSVSRIESDGDSQDSAESDASTDMVLTSTEDIKISLKAENLIDAVSNANTHVEKIAKWVLVNAEGIAGGSNQWHNLVDYLEELNYHAAKIVLNAGRERYPSDATLLADAIHIAGKLGQWTEGDSLVQLAQNAGSFTDEYWTFSVYVASYLEEKAKTQNQEERKATYDSAVAFLDAAIDRIGPDDHMLNQKAEILLKGNRVEEAKQLLEKMIFQDDLINGVHNENKIPVAQCCCTYLAKILNSSCDYDKIVKVAEAGIRFSAIEQQPVVPDYFLYRKALALDGKLFASGFKANVKDSDFVKEILKTYALSYSLTGEASRKKVCRNRFMTISALSGIADIRIEDYCATDAEQ